MASWLFFAGALSRPTGVCVINQEAAVPTDDRHVVVLTLLAQLSLSLVLAAVVWLWQGKVAAVSALLGGMVAVIPNGFLAARLLKPRADAKAMLRAAWVGEIGKLVLTAVLFGAIFGTMRSISALAVFGGFIAVQSVVLGSLLYQGGSRG